MAQVTDSGLLIPNAKTVKPGRAAAIACWLAAIVLATCWAAFGARAASAMPEYALKATYLLDFTKFVEWPATALGAPDATFNICVYGGDPFAGALDEIVRGETAAGHHVIVKQTGRNTQPGPCQILFVSNRDEDVKNIPGVGVGVLTVGEGENFIRNGGMIGFVIENRRVRFEINRMAAEGAGLKLSSGLLRVAKAVTQ